MAIQQSYFNICVTSYYPKVILQYRIGKEGKTLNTEMIKVIDMDHVLDKMVNDYFKPKTFSELVEELNNGSIKNTLTINQENKLLIKT